MNEIKTSIDLEETFLRRARGLRNQSWVVLGLILLLLGCAVLVFFYADEIVKKDIAIVTSQDIRKQIIEIEGSIPENTTIVDIQNALNKNLSAFVLEFQNKVTNLKEEFAASKNIKLRRFSQKEFPEIPTKDFIKTVVETDRCDYNIRMGFPKLPLRINLVKLEEKIQMKSVEIAIDLGNSEAVDCPQILIQKIEGDFENLRSDVAQISNAISGALATANIAKFEWEKLYLSKSDSLPVLEKRFTELKDLEITALGANNKKELSWSLLAQTNITRFGPMIVIFFFVTILVNLYRYSVRLAAFYHARADALMMYRMKLAPDKFGKLASALSPDDHDIGKAPKMPTDYVMEIAKKAVDKIPTKD